MMHPAKLLPFLLLIFLASCTTTSLYTGDSKSRASEYARDAKTAIGKDNYILATYKIKKSLEYSDGITALQKIFNSYPSVKSNYLRYFSIAIDHVDTPYNAKLLYDRITTITSAKIYSEDITTGLFDSLEKKVMEGNLSGQLAFDLESEIDPFPILKTPEHQRILADRTIEEIQMNINNDRPIQPLMEYVQRVGKDSEEGKRVKAVFAEFFLNPREMSSITSVFPEFVTAWKEPTTQQVFLKVENADRLFAEDLLEILRSKIQGVEWVSSESSATITVIVEQIRNNERDLPERTETITYSNLQVDILKSTILMPRNASYLYDIVSGGVEIDYGFAVSAVKKNKTIYDELVRGNIKKEYHRCQNSRIRNVFGGVTSAGFVANTDMRKRCSGPNSVSINSLRKDILDKIANAVLKIAPIKKAHIWFSNKSH